MCVDVQQSSFHPPARAVVQEGERAPSLAKSLAVARLLDAGPCQRAMRAHTSMRWAHPMPFGDPAPVMIPTFAANLLWAGAVLKCRLTRARRLSVRSCCASTSCFDGAGIVPRELLSE